MPPARGDIVAAVDVGSSKVSALIAQLGEDGGVTVLGTGQRESRGVRRGYVADMGLTELAIRNALEQAERIAGLNVDSAWVSFAAGGLESTGLLVERRIGGNRIDAEDIDHLLETARDSIDPMGKRVLHARPVLYTIDGLNAAADPLGLFADRLSVEVHVVLADEGPVRNVEAVVRNAHLDVAGIIAAPLASGIACLTDEEREVGVAVIEMGASVTNLSTYAGGVLTGLATIGWGAGDITDDIAAAFGIRRAQAERLKAKHGSAESSPRDHVEQIAIEREGEEGGAAEGEARRITRAQLIAVIRTRLDHQLPDLKAALAAAGMSGPVGRPLVLTGGGAELAGIADYLQAALGRPVRIGRPAGLKALPEAHGGPAFATLAGLALIAARGERDLAREPSAPLAGEGGGGFLPARLARALRRWF